MTTLNLSMQAQMEQILQQEYQKTKSQGISAIIMDPHTGQIKAMANYPTYDPAITKRSPTLCCSRTRPSTTPSNPVLR